MAPLIVGIAGGSGSGKTTLATDLVAALSPGQAAILPADAYYRDLSHLPAQARAHINFDEPAALDGERLRADLLRLRQGQAVQRPRYDFVTHTRQLETDLVSPSPLVLVEGILVLALPEIDDLLDVTVFVEASEAVRLERRIARDVGQRGRSRASVLAQFAAHTRPMHERFVEPSRARATLVVSGEDARSAMVSRVREAILRRIQSTRRA
jgi:uridine kinase